MTYRQMRLALVLLDGFVAITSIACGAGLAMGVLPVPSEWLRGTPFSDYTLVGLIMAVVVGGSALAAAAATLREREAGILLSAIAGLLLAGCEIVEVTLFDPNLGSWLLLVVPLQVVYSVIALASIGLAVVLWKATYRGQHAS